MRGYVIVNKFTNARKGGIFRDGMNAYWKFCELFEQDAAPEEYAEYKRLIRLGKSQEAVALKSKWERRSIYTLMRFEDFKKLNPIITHKKRKDK